MAGSYHITSQPHASQEGVHSNVTCQAWQRNPARLHHLKNISLPSKITSAYKPVLTYSADC